MKYNIRFLAYVFIVWSSKQLGGLRLRSTMKTEEPGTSGEQVATGGEPTLVSGVKLFVYPGRFYGRSE